MNEVNKPVQTPNDKDRSAGQVRSDPKQTSADSADKDVRRTEGDGAEARRMRREEAERIAPDPDPDDPVSP